MLRRIVPGVVLSVALAGSAALFAAQKPLPGVIVHEWGTFTTVADDAGRAMNWMPLGGPTDLPCFVEHYKNRLFKVVGYQDSEGPIDYEAARSNLVGRVRMETPVLYFYAPAETVVRVGVRFRQGVITEWYPSAVANQPNVMPSLLDNPNVVGGLDWPSVTITPGSTASFPSGPGPSHYYAARDTDASPLRVNGQTEKFLFYRGVGSFPVPISAALASDGSVQVTNLGTVPLPAVIRFDNDGGQMSFRIGRAVGTTVRFERPSASSSVAALRADLVRLLTEAGLYPREAEAMVATWKDDWFEEGTRVFYLVPSQTVGAVLPLTVTPAPAVVARVFVGRMEILTPESVRRVQTALASRDFAALERQGRFLGPIADRLAANLTSVSDRTQIGAVTTEVFARYVTRFAGCH